jgi:hypothetical protein
LTMHSEPAAGEQNRRSVRTVFGLLGLCSVSVARFLPFLRLTAFPFGIDVRFRPFGSGAGGKAVTFLGLSFSITKGMGDS